MIWKRSLRRITNALRCQLPGGQSRFLAINKNQKNATRRPWSPRRWRTRHKIKHWGHNDEMTRKCSQDLKTPGERRRQIPSTTTKNCVTGLNSNRLLTPSQGDILPWYQGQKILNLCRLFKSLKQDPRGNSSPIITRLQKVSTNFYTTLLLHSLPYSIVNILLT